jgi:hypothetical protein
VPRPSWPSRGSGSTPQLRACKRQRIYDLVTRRTIPHRKEGTRLLFKLSHLDAWIAGGGAT